MTTIVADASIGLIGADRYCTPGFYCRKMFHTKKHGSFGCSGDDRPIARFEAWLLHKGPRPTQVTDDDEEFSAVQLYKGEVYRWDEAMVPRRIDSGYCAVGAGAQYALGALDAGADIFQAMRIAGNRADGTKPPYEFMDESGRVLTEEAAVIEFQGSSA